MSRLRSLILAVPMKTVAMNTASMQAVPLKTRLIKTHPNSYFTREPKRACLDHRPHGIFDDSGRNGSLPDRVVIAIARILGGLMV